MKDLTTLDYFPPVKKLADVLCAKTQSSDPLFFRIMVSYYFAKVASMMRCNIKTLDRGDIPVSMYAINLANCVDKDTEFLTPTGWKKISKYKKGDKILQVDPYDHFNACFVEPKAYINQPALLPAYRVKPNSRTRLSMMVSPNHGMLYGIRNRDKNFTYHTKIAKGFFNSSIKRMGIPSHFKQNDLNLSLSLSDEEIQVQVAFAADGCIKPAYKLQGRLRVKKQRKVDRIRALLQAANISFNEKLDSGQTAFWFNPPILTKNYDWAWKANAKQLALITHESVHWDGCIDKRTGNYNFDSTIKADADFMQYAYQATFDTVISLNVNDRRGRVRTLNEKDYVTKSIDYRVSQSSAKIKNIQPKNVTLEPMPDGREYCFTTNTGYWLMRKDNHITVTQNSGHGKGHSTNIVEEQIINEFRTRFLEETFPAVSETNLIKLANLRAIRKGNDDETELAVTQAEFENLGVLAFSFDSGTTAAVKQMRHKLLMSSAGSMNLEMDEIGSNLFGNIDVLTTFLELYDVGKVKPKLIKNTSENKRNEEIHGRTPTNMMLFGTPSKLLNDAKEQEEFMSMLDIGYARRCIFGYTRRTKTDTQLTPEEVYDILTDKSSDTYIKKLSHQLGNLADIINFDTTLFVKKEVSLINIAYKLDCERRAEQFADHQDIQNAEMCHRYFKALKLAGAYAFIDSSSEITEDHLYNAIKLVEDSGIAFQQIMTQEKAYVKLALYIANNENEVTQADIAEDLTFYKGSAHYKDQLLMMASSWGYKNNVIIRKYFRDGIEFFSGESLQETDLKNMKFAYSTDVAIGYENQQAPFDQLHKLIKANNIHWINHHLRDSDDEA